MIIMSRWGSGYFVTVTDYLTSSIVLFCGSAFWWTCRLVDESIGKIKIVGISYVYIRCFAL